MYPKTQSEVVKLIYNLKTVRNVNQMPVINARQELLKVGYLKPVDGYKLRGQKFTSTAKPYIEYLQKEMKEKRSRIKMRKKDKKAIEIIYNSEWFRELFQDRYLRDPRTGDEIIEVWRVYRTEKGRLVVDDVLYLIATILNNISTVASVIWSHLKDELRQEFTLPSVDDLVKAGDFDAMISEYHGDIDEAMLSVFYRRLHNCGKLIGKIVAENIGVGIMLIPQKIAWILMRAGRPQHTAQGWGPVALTSPECDKPREERRVYLNELGEFYEVDEDDEDEIFEDEGFF
jgi:hypothetical protein